MANSVLLGKALFTIEILAYVRFRDINGRECSMGYGVPSVDRAKRRQPSWSFMYVTVENI